MTAPNPLLTAALKSPHAHLLFKDRDGTPVDYEVAKLWTEPPMPKPGDEIDPAALDWKAEVAVTNDPAILRYFLKHHDRLPTFPMAGDRPAYYFDPAAVTVGVVNAGGPAPGLNVVN